VKEILSFAQNDKMPAELVLLGLSRYARDRNPTYLATFISLKISSTVSIAMFNSSSRV
jgi:hypothetical protein